LYRLTTQNTNQRRIKLSTGRKKIVLSGAFDPPTLGHTKMFQHASLIGDIIVVLNTDDWILRNKYRVFLDREKRKKILYNMPGVVKIVDALDEDDTVCESLKKIRPDMFGNGGHRNRLNTPEIDLCRKLDIQLVWKVGSVEDNKNTLDLYTNVIEHI